MPSVNSDGIVLVWPKLLILLNINKQITFNYILYMYTCPYLLNKVIHPYNLVMDYAIICVEEFNCSHGVEWVEIKCYGNTLVSG